MAMAKKAAELAEEPVNLDSNEFDIGASVVKRNAPDLEVVVEDDTPEEDKGRPRRAEDHKPYDVSDEEIDKYDESVKKRIKRLRFEYHEERRLKDEAARRELAAIEHARRLVSENARLNTILQQGEKTLVSVARAKAEANINAAKRSLAEAHAAGDADKISSATAEISKSVSELEALNFHQPSIPGELPSPEDSVRAFDAQVMAARKPQGPHPKAIEWYERNKGWFEKDPMMTEYAKRVDAALIQRGSNPGGDEHYRYIDTEMRRVFPNRGLEEAADGGDDEAVVVQDKPKPKQKVGPVVRSVSGGGSVTKGKRRMTLTSSEAAIARKLGLSLEDYAEQKAMDYPDE